MKIAKTTMPQMTPAIMGPFGVGMGVSTTTVGVWLGATEAVDAATTLWVVGEGVEVEEDLRMLEVMVELEAEELDDIVLGQVGRLQASTERKIIGNANIPLSDRRTTTLLAVTEIEIHLEL
jgi:hypothetical protein